MRMIPFKYQITSKISQTPYVTLFHGSFQNDEGIRPCFLKKIHNQQIAPDDLAQIKLTYQRLQQFNDGHIVQLLAVKDVADGLLLIFEDFSNISINDLRIGFPLSLSHFFRIAIPVTKGVTTLHTHHLIHGHIKPYNILFAPDSGRVKLRNVDISPFLAQETSWHDLDILRETLPYISPEQSGRLNYEPDYRTDFYTLGITFYQLLTRNLPS